MALRYSGLAFGLMLLYFFVINGYILMMANGTDAQAATGESSGH